MHLFSSVALIAADLKIDFVDIQYMHYNALGHFIVYSYSIPSKEAVNNAHTQTSVCSGFIDVHDEMRVAH